MKINECSVIDNKVIDYAIRTLIADGNNVLAQELKQHLKPLNTVVRDALEYNSVCKFNCFGTYGVEVSSCECHSNNESYINETDI